MQRCALPPLMVVVGSLQRSILSSALASALAKIEGAEAPTKSIKKSAAHLCIADPLGRKVNLKEGRLANLFGTHPPMPMRISRLKGMAFQQAKAAGLATS